MKEIEVKLLDIDVQEIGCRLLELGAERTFAGDVEVVFYDFPDGSLRSDAKRLRLRTFGDQRIELTYKQKICKEHVKIAEEYQVNVTNHGEMHQILKHIGLQKVHAYTKHRISFRKGDVFFEIDSIPGCPPLMEIEAASAEKVYEWVERLGFHKNDAKPWSGTDVIAYYHET